MQSFEGTPEESHGNSLNAKVYISNINKTVPFCLNEIDEETLKKMFNEIGPIRSCILKKKPNDVTYSFIEYEKASDAARAIAKYILLYTGLMALKHGGGNLKLSTAKNHPTTYLGMIAPKSITNHDGPGTRTSTTREREATIRKELTLADIHHRHVRAATHVRHQMTTTIVAVGRLIAECGNQVVTGSAATAEKAMTVITEVGTMVNIIDFADAKTQNRVREGCGLVGNLDTTKVTEWRAVREGDTRGGGAQGIQ
jgi:hypothetical protein